MTPTASQALLTGFSATPDIENWLRGIYLFGIHFRTGIVVIHQLPETPETLWLRILGRGGVQQRAIEELTALPQGNEFWQGALELLYDLQANLAASQRLGKEDRTLVMALAPLYRQRFEATLQQGLQQGIEQGLQQGLQQGIERGRIEGQRSVLENFLRVRWGELDPGLMVLLTPLSALSAMEFAMLLVRLSALSVEENGLESVRELLAQTLLRMRFGELDDECLVSLVARLLALSPEELESFLLQWSQLSDEEILAGLQD